MTMKSEPLYHSELFSFIFDLLWETTFLYSCLELFVDTGYVQGTSKMIMRGGFVEACWSRRGGKRVSGPGSGRMLCYGQIHVESCNDDDDLNNFYEKL